MFLHPEDFPEGTFEKPKGDDPFDEVLRRCLDGEAQNITRDGEPVAVLVPYDEYMAMIEIVGGF